MGKKKICIVISFLLIISLVSLSGCSKKDPNKKKIGIFQIAEHAALDSARDGFIQGLKEGGFEDGVNIIINKKNAQGSPMTADTIAKKFVSDKSDLIFAIATPCAQSAYNATKTIPVVITAVTDPVDAGIVKSIDKPDTNVTGTSDRFPVEEQIKLLKLIMPNAKKVGYMYNTGEKNSIIQLKELKEICVKYDLTIVATGITNVNEAAQSLNSIIDDIDVLYTPTDNLIAASMPLISEKCFLKNKPIFGAERAHVESGALITKGIDYKLLGKESAKIAIQILNGTNPSVIPVAMQDKFEIVINEDAAKKLNITIPDSIIKDAIKIKGGVK